MAQAKKVIRRRREKKNIERGQVHHPFFFQQHHGNRYRYPGQCYFLGFLRRTGFPRQQEVHSLRGSDRSRDGCPRRYGAWPEDR